MEFKSVEFMSKEDKEKVFKQFKTFINSLAKGEFKLGFNRNENPISFKYFTKRIYEHLHLNCGFIAHYDIYGFYNTYFNDLNDLKNFIDYFLEEEGYNNYNCSYEPYADINKAIADILKENLKSLYLIYSKERIEDLRIQKGIIEQELKTLV